MLELKSVSAGYGKKKVLSDISISFPPGKINSVIGPNGSGKTTLLKAAAGLIPISSGEILLDGGNINGMERKEIAKHISFLPQIKSAGSLTVRALALHGRFPYLAWPRRYGENDIRITEEAIRMAGVSGIADKIMNELSGGQQQRAYLAMLLAQETEIVFLDEPASFLDINAQMELCELVNKLKSLGRTIIMISHDLHSALLNSDCVMVMKCGRLMGYGTPAEIADGGFIEDAFGVKPVFSDDAGQYFFRKI